MAVSLFCRPRDSIGNLRSPPPYPLAVSLRGATCNLDGTLRPDGPAAALPHPCRCSQVTIPESYIVAGLSLSRPPGAACCAADTQTFSE